MNPIPRLSGDDRRAQIIEAVTPAVLEHGSGITTKQLAEAAGVAEGTLFKAFGDKESLLFSLAEHHLSMYDEAADCLSNGVPVEFDTLEAAVTSTVQVLVERMQFLFQLVVALGPVGQRAAAAASEHFDASKQHLTTRFASFRDQLRVEPVVAAELVRTLAWAAASGWGDSKPVSAVDDIIQVFLYGIDSHHGAASAAPVPSPRAGTTASALEHQKA